MNTRVRIWIVLTLLLFFGLTCLSNANPLLADGPAPTGLDSSDNVCEPGGVCSLSLPPAERFARGGPAAAERDPGILPHPTLAPEKSGGPDTFGYTWTDATPYSWEEATVGTNTGMSGYSGNNKVGPIDLGFPFHFYENKYEQVYISASGFLTFDANAPVPYQGHVPAIDPPNNVIAPYWAPFYLAGNGFKGKVFYWQRGGAPNRYFVVQWNSLHGGALNDPVGGDDYYTFQAILFETGEIKFQYKLMTFHDRYWCGTAGIENSTGLNGLTTLPYCKTIKQNKAILFERPAPRARIEVTPNPFGGFSPPGSTAAYSIRVRNTGDRGSDTFSPSLSNSDGWTAALYAADGVTPVSSIGPLEEGETADLVLKQQVPNDAVAGDSGGAFLHLTSAVDPDVNTDATFSTAVTPDLTVAFHDAVNGAMSLDLIRDSTQTIVKVTSDDYKPTYPGVLRQPNNHYVAALNERYCANGPCSVVGQVVQFVIVGPNGEPAGAPPHAIKGLPDLRKSTYQFDYGMASAPDNSIAFGWVQEVVNAEGKWNDNLFFGILDSSGNLIVPARKLTKNISFGNSTSEGVPNFLNVHVTATTDNHYLVVWQQETLKGGKWVSDIYYQVFDTAGKVIKKATKFTKSTPGDGYYSPTALGLANGNVLLAFTRISNRFQAVYVGVVDAAGKKVQKAKRYTVDPYYNWYHTDAAQLSDGRVVLAWNAYINSTLAVRYMTLDGSSYAIAIGPNSIAAQTVVGNGAPSITADDNGHAMLTFHDYPSAYRHNLYYALLPLGGNVPVFPFQHSDTYITSSFGGLGNAK